MAEDEIKKETEETTTEETEVEETKVDQKDLIDILQNFVEALIPEAEEIFASLFGWFNSLVMPLMETEAETFPEETTVETTLPDVVILTEEEKQQLTSLLMRMKERSATYMEDR